MRGSHFSLPGAGRPAYDFPILLPAAIPERELE